MIKTLSPYYISIPRVNPNTSVVCGSYTFKLYVWSGNKTAVPSVADYEITRINAASSSVTDKVDISRIVNDYIEFNCIQSTVTSLEDGENQYWVKTEVYYDDEPYLEQLESIDLALKGYGYFMEGQNPQIPSNKILLEGDEFKVGRNGYFVLPILMDEETPPTPVITIEEITEESGDDLELTFDTNVFYSHVSLKYRKQPDTVWTFIDIFTTNPFTFELATTAGTYEFQLYCFDPLTETVVYSNIYELIIT